MDRQFSAADFRADSGSRLLFDHRSSLKRRVKHVHKLIFQLQQQGKQKLVELVAGENSLTAAPLFPS